MANLDCEAGDRIGEKFKELPKLRDVDHPQVPSLGHSYFKRELRDGVTDLSVVTKSMADPDFATLLEGETGVGKGVLIKHICEKTKRPLVRMNFGVSTTKEKLIGGYVPAGDREGDEAILEKAQKLSEESKDLSTGDALDFLDNRSNFQWKDGLLTKAVRYGWVFLADEINASDPGALVALNGLLETKGNRSLEIPEKSEVVEPHPEFKLVATQNPSHYAGVRDLNSAFKGRFYPIEIPHLEPRAEQRLLFEQTSFDRSSPTDKDDVESLVEIANKIRDGYPTDYVTPISTRDLIKVGNLAEMMDTRDATKIVFEGIAGEEDRNAINKAIDTIL